MELQGVRAKWTAHDDPPREGGQGQVLRGRGENGQSVAIKIARQARSRMAQECASLQEIAREDPRAGEWCVQVLDHGTAGDGRDFFVLPWYEDTLESWCERQPPLESLLLGLERAAATVVRLHRSHADLARVRVHRDLKPPNFLVRDQNGRVDVVLADLGVAKDGKLLVATRQTGVFTPHFAPMEQMLPVNAVADVRQDVHGLGATLFACLTGTIPRSIVARDTLWTAEATRIVYLAGRGASRSGDEVAEYQQLRGLPLERFIDFDEAHALLPSDEQRLFHALEERLGRRCAEPGAGARALAELLLPTLRKALAPNPRDRLHEASQIYASLQLARDAACVLLGVPREPTGAPMAATSAAGSDSGPYSTPTVPDSSGLPSVIATAVPTGTGNTPRAEATVDSWDESEESAPLNPPTTKESPAKRPTSRAGLWSALVGAGGLAGVGAIVLVGIVFFAFSGALDGNSGAPAAGAGLSSTGVATTQLPPAKSEIGVEPTGAAHQEASSSAITKVESDTPSVEASNSNPRVGPDAASSPTPKSAATPAGVRASVPAAVGPDSPSAVPEAHPAESAQPSVLTSAGASQPAASLTVRVRYGSDMNVAVSLDGREATRSTGNVSLQVGLGSHNIVVDSAGRRVSGTLNVAETSDGEIQLSATVLGASKAVNTVAGATHKLRFNEDGTWTLE